MHFTGREKNDASCELKSVSGSGFHVLNFFVFRLVFVAFKWGLLIGPLASSIRFALENVIL